MKKKSLIFGILLLGVVFTASQVSGTYARYITSEEGTATAAVAKWAAKITNAEGDTLSETNAVTFTPVSSAFVASGKIAPSLSATGQAIVDLRGTEVAVDLKVTIDTDSITDTNLAALVDSGRLTLTAKLDNTTTITSGTAQLIELANVSAEHTVDLTLEWTESDDNSSINPEDTLVGKNVTTIELPITITAKQHVGA